MDTGIFIGDKIITTSWDKIWNKPTTLSGYGITDAYTKTDADGKYVLKAGDTITGKLLFNANSSIDLVYIPRTKSAIIFNNAGSNRIGINSTDGDGNLRIAKTDINQDWVSGDVNILLGSNNYKVLHTGNYAGELDNRYVNKIGDAMTGNLVFAHTSERPSYSGSIGITFREQRANGQAVKLVYNDYDNYRAPAGLILVGEQGGEYFEAPAIYQNGYKVWDAGNDGSGSGLDADLLDGKHLHQGQWNSICYIGEDGVLEIGKYIDFHEEQGMSSDFSCRIMSQGDYQNTLHLPTSSGTLATLGDNVASATKLQTPRYIFSKPFDGTNNVTGGAKFLNICIETDNNGNDSGRRSEINNYVGPLQLQQASPNGIHMCMGGGQVGICTTSPKYTLHVDGVIYAKDGFRETSDIRKKKVLTSHTVDLDDMAYADLFDYTLIDDEKEIVRVGTNAHYWLDKLPQVVTKDNDEYLSLNYGVLGTVCALSVSKYVKQLEDRVTLLENKIASLQ